MTDQSRSSRSGSRRVSSSVAASTSRYRPSHLRASAGKGLVGFVGERPIAIELQFWYYRGCGAGHWFGGLGGHGIVSVGMGRALAAFLSDGKRGLAGLHRRSRHGARGGGRRRRRLCFRCKAGPYARRRKVAAAVAPPISAPFLLSEGRRRGSRIGGDLTMATRLMTGRSAACVRRKATVRNRARPVADPDASLGRPVRACGGLVEVAAKRNKPDRLIPTAPARSIRLAVAMSPASSASAAM